MAAPDLVLDPSIRTWVVYPILIVMILVGLIRHYAAIVMTADPIKPVGEKERIQAAYLTYGTALASNYFNVPKADWSAQVGFLAPRFRNGMFLADPNAKPATPLTGMSDPRQVEGMLAGVKNQVLTFVPQTLIMSWVSTFFGGIIVMKLPFPLTIRFKEMLQSGINTSDLDVRWVSSISWYILLLMGLSSVYALVLGSDNKANQQQQQQQSPFGAPGIDYRKVFAGHADTLELLNHKNVLEGVEKRVLDL